MNTPNTLLLILGFFGFLLVNLLLGLYKGRGVKTMKDYALANRAMGTGTLMITIIATLIGCNYVTSVLIAGQEKGIINFVFPVIACTPAGLLLGRVIFPKLLRFKNCYTLGDIMGQHYGPKAQLFTGIISVFLSILIIAGQFVALKNIATMFGYGADSYSTYIIIGVVGIAVTLYTFTGGMRAVAATDVLQFALVMGGFAFMAYQVLGLKYTNTAGQEATVNSIGGFFKAIQDKVAKEHLPHLSIGSHARFKGIAISILEGNIIFFSPPIINRVLAARNRSQVRQAFTGFTFFYMGLILLLTFIGFGLLLTYGYGKEAGKISEHNVAEVMQKYLFQERISATAVQFLFIVMLLGVVMSTADSFLNALIVVVVRDILHYKQPNKAPDSVQLQYIKKIALVGGLASIAFAYVFCRLGAYSATISDTTRNLFGFLVVMVIAAAFRLKGNHKTFFYTASVFLSLFTIVAILFQSHIWVIGKEEAWAKLYFRRKMRYGVTPILLITALLFLVIHKKVYGRLTWEKPAVKRDPVRQMGGIKKKWRTIFFNPLVWAKDTFARYGNEPTAVGFFLALSSVARVTISPRFHAGYTMIFTILNISAVLVCALLMLHVIWRQAFKPYFPLFYYGALIYILPFMHILLFLYQPFSTILIVQLAMSVILLHLLVDWRSYCLFTLVGGLLALLVYWISYAGPAPSLSETNDPTIIKYNHIWVGFVTFSSALGLGFVFGSRQEQINTQRLKRTKTYAAAFGHDLLNLYQCPQSTIDCVQYP